MVACLSVREKQIHSLETGRTTKNWHVLLVYFTKRNTGYKQGRDKYDEFLVCLFFHAFSTQVPEGSRVDKQGEEGGKLPPKATFREKEALGSLASGEQPENQRLFSLGHIHL